MDEIIVYAPKDSNADYDYIAFSFDGKHSYEDLHIIRTSDGDRYNENLFPTLKDTAVEAPGGDGMYFLKTSKGPREFVINFAFDDLDDAQIEQLKETFDTTKVGPLWFAEYPFKVYEAKVKTPVVLKYLCFDENGVNKYKGEGTVNFICYQPYARTPDEVWNWQYNLEGENGEWVKSGDGKFFGSYNNFKNKDQWKQTFLLPINKSDFIASKTSIIAPLYYLIFNDSNQLTEITKQAPISVVLPRYSSSGEEFSIITNNIQIAKNVKYLTLKDNITSIGDNFLVNTELKELNMFKANIGTINNTFFYQQPGFETLQKICLPNNLKELSLSKEDNVTKPTYNGLKEVHIDSLLHWNNITFESNPDNPLKSGAGLYINNHLVKNLSLNSSNLANGEVGMRAYRGYQELKHLTIENAAIINHYAFQNCSNLEEITFDTEEEIILKNQAMQLSATAEIPKLKNINIPSYEWWLSKVTFDSPGSNPLYASKGAATITSKGRIIEYLDLSDFQSTSTIPQTALSSNQFKAVILPDASEIFIKGYAFYHTHNLKYIYIPENCKFLEISQAAFHGSSKGEYTYLYYGGSKDSLSLTVNKTQNTKICEGRNINNDVLLRENTSLADFKNMVGQEAGKVIEWNS